MALTLGSRLRVHMGLLILHSALFMGLAAVIVVPALVHVDRTLAPLQGVFGSLSERQSRMVERLDSMVALLESPSDLEPGHRHLSRLTGPERSLMSQYATLLDPAAVEDLVEIENRFATVETELSQVQALHELGDSGAARRQLQAVQASLGDLLHYTTEAMAMALERGSEARTRYQRAMLRLGWVAAAWFVTGGTLLFLVSLDLRRRVLQPISDLDVAVRALARGEWTTPVVSHGDDEVTTLLYNFTEMAETLRSRAGGHARLVAAGELLAGVAHELNNPLQSIRASAELNASNRSDEAAEDWRRVHRQANRAAKLVQDLLKFVRPSTRRARLVSLNEVVREGLELIEFQYRADGIEVLLELSDETPPVHADPDELLQVIVNILGNAHRVLEDQAGPRRVWISSESEGGEVRVIIWDSGPGVPEDVRDRVFDPFFTNRAQGFGLGLAVSRDIARRWDGRLDLNPGVGGASFTLALPAAEGSMPAEPPPVLEKQSGQSFEGSRVLVVDDEDAVRGVLVRFFRQLGATVDAADGGNTALQHIQAQPFDLVILDLRMPDLDGIQVYQSLRETRPEVAARTIFLSGDITRIDADVGIDHSRVLVKPVELSELRQVAAHVLGGK